MEHWAKFFFWKKHPKTSSKHVWTLLGSSLGIFGILENFWFFWKFSKTRPSMKHWAKKFFQKNHPKTSSKHVWTLLGTILGIFGILKNFWLFWKFSKTRPSMEHWAKIFFDKITLKHLQNTFGHFWERFWAFLEFLKFFDFFEIFEDSTLHGTLSQFFFEKKHPKTSSKHVWTLLGSNLGIFGILENFWFFWKFSKTRPSMEHWAKKFFEKVTLKHLQNTFGNFWEGIWAFLEFWKIFDFFENFRRLDPPWNTGQENFSKKSP